MKRLASDRFCNSLDALRSVFVIQLFESRIHKASFERVAHREIRNREEQHDQSGPMRELQVHDSFVWIVRRRGHSIRAMPARLIGRSATELADGRNQNAESICGSVAYLLLISCVSSGEPRAFPVLVESCVGECEERASRCRSAECRTRSDR